MQCSKMNRKCNITVSLKFEKKKENSVNQKNEERQSETENINGFSYKQEIYFIINKNLALGYKTK